jgi:hypothetical protein
MDVADARDRFGLEPTEAEAYADRVQQFDRNTLRLAALEAEAGLDTRAAMLVRIDRVIADLVDQLGGEVVPWP